MGVMKMKEIIAEHEKIGSGGLRNFSNLDQLQKDAESIHKISESIEEGADKFKEILLSKVSEEMFVEFMEAIQTLALSAMASNGCGFDLITSHANGDLEGYTHTVIFSVIGALINEEIL